MVADIGGDFNVTSGQFVCRYSGVYVFTVDMLKAYSAPSASCHIRTNGFNRVVTYSNPSINSGRGFYASSASAAVHLYRGDTADVGGYSDAATLHYDTAFSGFLLTVD